jgi:hypothetical protein
MPDDIDPVRGQEIIKEEMKKKFGGNVETYT